MIHSKHKGNLGSSATIKELHKLNYSVFVELGDLSKVDLIAERDKKLIKIQVKYVDDSKEGLTSVVLPLIKKGPNGYRYAYTTFDIDLFSVYLPKRDKVLFIPSKIACKNRSMFNIRLKKSKNNQTERTHDVSEFEDLQKVLDTI